MRRNGKQKSRLPLSRHVPFPRPSPSARPDWLRDSAFGQCTSGNRHQQYCSAAGFPRTFNEVIFDMSTRCEVVWTPRNNASSSKSRRHQNPQRNQNRYKNATDTCRCVSHETHRERDWKSFTETHWSVDASALSKLNRWRLLRRNARLKLIKIK